MRDPYLYDDVPVLKNKLNIKDAARLQAAEADITFIKFLSIDKLDQGQELDFDYVKVLHRHIFEDVYPFAGQTRTVQIYKAEAVLGGDTIRYSHPDNIEGHAVNIIDEMNGINWRSLSLEDRSMMFSKNIAALWQVHPFREGNTRTTMTFASHFAGRNDFPLDKQLFRENASFVRNALVKASDGMYADYQYLNKIMKDSMVLGEEAFIVDNIKSAGFRPTKLLIQGMKDINQAFQKLNLVKELRDYYKNIKSLDKDKGELVRSVAKDFADQEIQNKKVKSINQARNISPER
ncbi:Fic/DOC family protein [Lacrimispora amygdalina]|uniref:Fic/DOC family protein n=1 Tax=Lacrimispora amygdalina TaxID=253257 RepID=UPI000BE22480|nr:Fic family protein [Lacrimispora amygdalina]